MKRIVEIFFVLLIAFSSCTQEKQISSVQDYLRKIKNPSAREGFPFDVVHNQLLPNLTGGDDYYSFEKSLEGNEAYFYEGYKKQVKYCNVQNPSVIQSINFAGLESFPFLRFELLSNDLAVWSGDSSLIFLYDKNGNANASVNLPLSYQGKQYSIFTGPRRLIEFFPVQKTLIIPVTCVSEYEESDTRNLPQFVAYNLNTSELDFLPIYLPANYPVDKYLGELNIPVTAKDGNAFYAIFPLSNHYCPIKLFKKRDFL